MWDNDFTAISIILMFVLWLVSRYNSYYEIVRCKFSTCMGGAGLAKELCAHMRADQWPYHMSRFVSYFLCLSCRSLQMLRTIGMFVELYLTSYNLL